MEPKTFVGEPEPVDTPAPPSAAVQLDDVTKSFGPVVAVDDVSLAIQPGEIVALLGPNGAGKTTTIDMILGLSDPTRGRVTVHGLTPRTAMSYGLVAGVMQNGGLLEDYTRPDRHLRDPLPRGGRRDFWSAIREDTGKGRTVIFATHYLEEADAYADRIVLIRATLPDASRDELAALAGVDTVEVRGDSVLLHGRETDAVARYLLTETPARDLEITSRNLEDAFVALTSDDADRSS